MDTAIGAVAGNKEMRMQVVVTEKQNASSQRAGELHEVKDLAAAKRIATRNQMFQGTTMTVETTDGRLLATKERGEWTDAIA